jgi:hypothetical protein
MAKAVAASKMHPPYSNADNGQRVQPSDCCGCFTLRRSRKQPLAASTQYIDGKLSADELTPIIKQFGNGGCLQWSTMQASICGFMRPRFMTAQTMQQTSGPPLTVLSPIHHNTSTIILALMILVTLQLRACLDAFDLAHAAISCSLADHTT